MVTPFLQNGEVDFQRLEAHTARLIENNVNYLVVLGTTAETPTLSKNEKQEILDCVVKAAGGKVPLMAGFGGNDTRALIESLGEANLQGYDSILSVSPYYNKPTQEGIYQHFAALASVSELPVLLYNVPGRTGSNMEASTTLRLAEDFQGKIFGIKEASGDMRQVERIIAERPDNFLVISGDDAFALDMIKAGGEGVISVAGNAIPASLATLVHCAFKQDYEEAMKLQNALLPFTRAIFREGNPAGIKAAMELKGWCKNVLRLPLLPASKELQLEIKKLLERF